MGSESKRYAKRIWRTTSSERGFGKCGEKKTIVAEFSRERDNMSIKKNWGTNRREYIIISGMKFKVKPCSDALREWNFKGRGDESRQKDDTELEWERL